MKRFLLISLILFTAGSLVAQTPTVANLAATGTGIKWYTTSSGGTALTTATPLVNAQHYWASQTVNGVESTTRFEVTATLITQAAPTSGTHTPLQTHVVWNWNTATEATGYKWGTTSVYANAIDMSNTTTKTETSLICNTSYTRYLWAYNGSGCVSVVTALTQTTSACGWTGGLTSYRGNINSEYDFIVTGTTTGSVWGCSNLYTDDSALETAAVHAGYVINGQTRTVKVRILAGQPNYTGCTQNGVTSSLYASWPGSYQIISSQ
jgi:hypothetical protein